MDEIPIPEEPTETASTATPASVPEAPARPSWWSDDDEVTSGPVGEAPSTEGGTTPDEDPTPASTEGNARPHRARGALAVAVSGLVALSVVAGAVGYEIGHRTSSGVSAANPFSQGGSGSPFSGGSGSPFSGGFGSPFSGGFGDGPFGRSSGSGATNGSGLTTVPSAIKSTESALVDVNTQLGYQQAVGAGTGIVLTSDGLVLTNNHVISGATSISVTDLGNGQTYRASVVGYDVSKDVAVLRLSGASGLTTATVDTSSNPTVGQSVYTIGNAGGRGGTPTVTTGSVTALNQSITASDEGTGTSEQLTGLIETSAALYSGDSGGAMTDTQGRVIGLDTAASATVSLSGSGQGYAIPIAAALDVAHHIINGDHVAGVHLGATAYLGLELRAGTGARVQAVVSGSPAATAGVTAGSTITSLNQTTVASSSQLVTLVTGLAPGDRVALGWTDATGATHRATLTLASGPPQ